MADYAAVVDGLAQWVEEVDARRREDDARLRATLPDLAALWSCSESEALWLLWDARTVSVYPKVSAIVRLVEGRHRKETG